MYLDASRTCADLMLDLAREVRVAVYPSDGTKGTLPASEQDRVRLLDSINDAADDFCTMRAWSFLSTEHDITTTTDGTGTTNVAGDERRYLLPMGFQGIDDAFLSWTGANAGGTARHVGRRDINAVVAQAPDSSGAPAMFSVRPCSAVASPSGDQRDQWEVVLWPNPDAAYTLTVPVRRTFVPMVDLTERPFWPSQHDRLVVAMAKLRYCELWPVGDMDKVLLRERVARLLVQSTNEDERNMPRSTGRITGTRVLDQQRAVVGEIVFAGTPLTY